ncbi:hypothetical protein LshimejAT787_1000050 [Lyophyllum shimeji]|uniref:Uncharacterized protein n=1 Tax=Lyophyllum shimeji TaxID=47721 RepID=A0A9P3PSV3_LYOSH|nr:hypothetical protein LshimejAT787_1000050 [Lyophyllum shimeji]
MSSVSASSTALVSLSLNGNIYRLPTSMVQPCVRMFTAMDRTFTNVASKQPETGLVWTYIPEAINRRRIYPSFLSLYADVDFYPVYGKGGISKPISASSSALTASASEDTLTDSRNASPTKPERGVQGPAAVPIMQQAEADTKATTSPTQGLCNDPEHSTTLNEMACALRQLDELKEANAKLTARVENLLPRWMSIKMTGLERDVAYLEKGVDALDLGLDTNGAASGARVAPAEVYIDEGTDCGDFVTDTDCAGDSPTNLITQEALRVKDEEPEMEVVAEDVSITDTDTAPLSAYLPPSAPFCTTTSPSQSLCTTATQTATAIYPSPSESKWSAFRARLGLWGLFGRGRVGI